MAQKILNEYYKIYKRSDFMENPTFLTALKNIEYKKSLADKNGYVNGISTATTDMTIEALEKQIPKKPIMNTPNVPVQIGNVRFGPGTTFYTCLICGTPTIPTHKYCGECGQRFDWGENDG